MRSIPKIVAIITVVAVGAASVLAQRSAPVQPTQTPLLPVGSVITFAGVLRENSASSWRVCRGQSVRKADFPALYQSIGTAWGQGDNPPNTFNLPDLRGQFLRGISDGLATDPDRTSRFGKNGGNSGDKVGSYQNDQFQTHFHDAKVEENTGGHNHPVQIQRNDIVGTNRTRDADADNEKWNADPRAGSITASIPADTGKHSHPMSVTRPTASNSPLAPPLRAGAETRPKNANIYWIIRVK